MQYQDGSSASPWVTGWLFTGAVALITSNREVRRRSSFGGRVPPPPIRVPLRAGEEGGTDKKWRATPGAECGAISDECGASKICSSSWYVCVYVISKHRQTVRHRQKVAKIPILGTAFF